MHNLVKLLERLDDSGVEFILIGGYAAVTHGVSYLTRDVDVCAVLSTENLGKLRRALAEWNPCHRMTVEKLSFLTNPPDGQTVKNLYLQTDQGALVVLTSVLGVGDFYRLKEQAETVVVDDRKYAVIGLIDLILAKESLARDKDLLVAKELRAIAVKRGLV